MLQEEVPSTAARCWGPQGILGLHVGQAWSWGLAWLPALLYRRCKACICEQLRTWPCWLMRPAHSRVACCFSSGPDIPTASSTHSNVITSACAPFVLCKLAMHKGEGLQGAPGVRVGEKHSFPMQAQKAGGRERERSRRIWLAARYLLKCPNEGKKERGRSSQRPGKPSRGSEAAPCQPQRR